MNLLQGIAKDFALACWARTEDAAEAEDPRPPLLALSLLEIALETFQIRRLASDGTRGNFWSDGKTGQFESSLASLTATSLLGFGQWRKTCCACLRFRFD